MAPTKKCEQCGEFFEKTPTNRNWTRTRFCSRSCGDRARWARGHGDPAEREERRIAENAEFIQDVQLLMPVTHPDELARRIGMTRGGILAKLRHLGRADLADQLLKEVERYGVPRGFRSSSSHCA